MIVDPRCRWIGFVTCALAVGAWLARPATATAAAVVVKQALTATSKAPVNARGQAVLTLATPSKGKLIVAAHGLPSRHTFDVVVRGVKVDTFTTNAHGAGKAKLRTGSRHAGALGKKQLLGFDPRGTQIIVRSKATGDDELVGDMPDGDDSASGAFACCQPDDDKDEVECEVKTPTDCTTVGGTPSQATSCLPNPCQSAPPTGTVCCIGSGSAGGGFLHEDDKDDEDSEVECEETSGTDCAEKGGTVVMATSCDPDPCPPTPPGSVVACCVADDDETECRMLTPETCMSKHGTPSGTSCASSPCQGDQGDDNQGDDNQGDDNQGEQDGGDGGSHQGGGGDGGHD